MAPKKFVVQAPAEKTRFSRSGSKVGGTTLSRVEFPEIPAAGKGTRLDSLGWRLGKGKRLDSSVCAMAHENGGWGRTGSRNESRPLTSPLVS